MKENEREAFATLSLAQKRRAWGWLREGEGSGADGGLRDMAVSRGWAGMAAARDREAVPLSPDERVRKRFAIFKHESQKDKALFPGPNDPREFRQRAEDRNRNTAKMYDLLGLTEYEAIEGFVRWVRSASDNAIGAKAAGKASPRTNDRLPKAKP